MQNDKQTEQQIHCPPLCPKYKHMVKQLGTHYWYCNNCRTQHYS